MENEQKNKVLTLIQKHYEDFYLQNAATNPEKVRSIQYFLDWIKTATVDDIDVKEIEFSWRTCNFRVNIDYFWEVGGFHSHQTININAAVASDTAFTRYFHDVYESAEANSKIIPGNLAAIVEKESYKFLRQYDRDAILSESKILSYEVSDPTTKTYLQCSVRYPHPVPDKDGNTTRSFTVIVFEDTLQFFSYWTHEKNYGSVAGPDDVNAKPASERKGGCYVATAVYGSYDCPQVWTLRRYRDETLASTRRGRAFIRFYYAVSPTLVKWFGKTKWFQKFWKTKLDGFVQKLNDSGVEDTPYDDKDWTK